MATHKSITWNVKIPPSSFECSPPVFYGDKRIIIPQIHDRGSQSIECYDCNNETMEIIIKYCHLPHHPKPNRSTCVIDKDTNTLYIIGGENTTFIQYNLDTNKRGICITEKQTKSIQKHNIIHTGIWPTSIVINNILHVIGGWENNSHYIMDFDTLRFYKIYSFPYNVYCHRTVYCKELDKLYLLGGFGKDNGYLDSIYVLDDVTKHFDSSYIRKKTSIVDGYVRSCIDCAHGDICPLICEYYLQSAKWRLMGCKLPKRMYGFGCVLLNKYIILFGGRSGFWSWMNTIHVALISDFKWQKLTIKCPQKNEYFAVLNEEKNMIHLFGYDDNNYNTHFTLNVDSLMSVIKNDDADCFQSVEYGKCAQCGMKNEGGHSNEDQLFYCYPCWDVYQRST